MNFRDVQELYALAKYVTGKNGISLLREILL